MAIIKRWVVGFRTTDTESAMTEYYIFSGVDGSGKTTMSNVMHGDGHKDRDEMIDSLTMTSDYSEWPVDLKDKDKIIILTADMDILRTRIDKRERLADLFETDRALYYYDCRFREIASYYGIPIIDTSNKTPEQIIWEIRDYDRPLSIPLKDMTADYCEKNFELITEGESKKVYADPYDENFCYIVLKNTIYSHSKQSTGEIDGLGSIRAENCRYFLNALRKNSIKHSYVAINNQGVIYSRRMYNINPLEVVVKEYVEGTDKHSYYGYKEKYADQNGKYVCGPYVRFDWRNPNHLDENGVDMRVSLKNYYKKEEEMGKEAFFNKYLTRPMGDKTINKHIIDNVVVKSASDIEEHAIKVYNTIKFYLAKAGLIIKDVCFMFSEEADGNIYCWSEINQDCMRVTGHDKDIWRVGGSAGKEELVNKWVAFNEKFRNIVNDFAFDVDNQYCYDYAMVIEKCYLSDTMNEFVHTDHYMKLARGSNGPRRFVVADSNKFSDCLYSLEHPYNSRQIRDNFPYVEVDSIDMAIEAISDSARRVVVPNIDFFIEHKEHELFTTYSNRVIVPVDTMDEVVTVFTMGSDDIAIMADYYNTDYDTQLIHLNFPHHKKFMVVDDLEQTVEAWHYGFVPIVPHFIEKEVARASISSEYVNIIYQHFDGTVVDRDRVRFNYVSFNSPGAEKYIFDKKDGSSILCVGDFSNIINTDNTVFSNQSVVKSNIISLYESTKPAPYSEVRLTNSVWDADVNPETLVTDFLSLLKHKNVDLRQVLNNLNADRWNVFKKYDLTHNKDEGVVSIAITGSKYDGKTEKYLLEVFGIKLLPPPSKRSLYRDYEVVDSEKFNGNADLTDKTIKFLMCKPKDMPYLLSAGYVDGVVTYDTVVGRGIDSNEFACVKPVKDPDLKLCLIKRKGRELSYPLRIAAEHPYEVKKALEDECNKEVVSVNGSSESYLVNEEMGFSLADAVVESGATLLENDLEVYKTIKKELFIGLFLKK